ncbi:uncharacterized protein V6R79_021205 [Siganus canaliculatus]
MFRRSSFIAFKVLSASCTCVSMPDIHDVHVLSSSCHMNDSVPPQRQGVAAPASPGRKPHSQSRCLVIEEMFGPNEGCSPPEVFAEAKADPDRSPGSGAVAAQASSKGCRKSSPALPGNQTGRKVIHEHAIGLLSAHMQAHPTSPSDTHKNSVS